MVKEQFLIAVDPSLTASGWALFSLKYRHPLAVGVIAAPGTQYVLAKRLEALQASVCELVEKMRLGEGDLLVCEGPAPLVLNPQSALKVERVRSIFETVARSYKMTVPGRINPRTVQTELLGMRGKQLARNEVKEWARSAAMKLFGSQLRNLPFYGVSENRRQHLPQDVIDALLIGSLAVSRIDLAERSNLSAEVAFDATKGGKTFSSRRGRAMSWSEQDAKKFLDEV